MMPLVGRSCYRNEKALTTPTAGIKSMRNDLSRVATGEIVTVYNPTSHIPGSIDAAQPGAPAAAPAPSIPDQAPASNAVPTNQAGPVPDWAATSVTILISE